VNGDYTDYQGLIDYRGGECLEGTTCPGGLKPLSVLFNAVRVLVCPDPSCTGNAELDSITVAGTDSESSISHTCIT
jgi:hypothetical protein